MFDHWIGYPQMDISHVENVDPESEKKKIEFYSFIPFPKKSENDRVYKCSERNDG